MVDSRVNASRDFLNLIFLRIDLDLDSQVCKQRLEAIVQSLADVPLASQAEQEAQVDLIVIWIESMLREYGVVGGENGAEWVCLDVRVLFGASDDFVQDADI